MQNASSLFIIARASVSTPTITFTLWANTTELIVYTKFMAYTLWVR